MTVRDNIDEFLHHEAETFKYYGLFYDGKLVVTTKARVYTQKGRLKSEFLSQNKHTLLHRVERDKNLGYMEFTKDTKRLLSEGWDEMIAEGKLEIKEI